MSGHLTLWIPGLRPGKTFASELSRVPGEELPDLTNLNLILSRADRVSVSDVIEHDYILNQLNQSLKPSHWPLAQWRLAIEELDLPVESKQWLCADPVYIHPDRAEALLLAHEELEIEYDEARQLAELINQYYQDEPWELHIGSTHRWYIRLDQTYDVRTSELQAVKGKNIFEFLPSGEDARYWQQCMNEMQMLLHGSEINQKREEQGRLPINSLWLWGYGQNETDKSLHWQEIYSNDPVIRGLGILSNIGVDVLPDELGDIKPFKGDVLLVNNQLQAVLQQQDIFAWLDELRYLEGYWFAPLVNEIKNDPDLLVTLVISIEEAYQFSRKQLTRWWRFKNKNRLF